LTIKYQEHEIDLTPPWTRIGFTEAIIKTNRLDPDKVNDPVQLRLVAKELGFPVKEDQAVGKILQDIFEKTVEPTLIQPTFVTDYPTDISPLAKRKGDEPSLTDRFELFINGLEMANGFSELNDPQDQRSRFEEQVRKRATGDQEAHPMDEEFLKALEHGMPPTAGEGIGIDRLIMLLTNKTSIREVIFFPQLRPEGK
jgi:lysyl-tRNA synthetase, class II